MTTLIFFITFLALLILFIRIIVKMIRRKPMAKTMKIIGAIVLVYSVLWFIFDLARKRLPVPMGTEVCFDDWCASVKKSSVSLTGDSLNIILTITTANHARGIAQTPSEPRVYILDESGHEWSFSPVAQKAYEKQTGAQPGIGHRLELHESLETALIFTIPRDAKRMYAIIEEGPWITNLLFPEDQMVFEIKY